MGKSAFAIGEFRHMQAANHHDRNTSQPIIFIVTRASINYSAGSAGSPGFYLLENISEISLWRQERSNNEMMESGLIGLFIAMMSSFLGKAQAEVFFNYNK